MSSSWCTIESDPGVFTELIQKIGVQGVQVEELYMLDSADLKKLNPVYGLIFLFKWDGKKDERPIDENAPAELFFANQVITNACATQAILSILMNLQTDRVILGPVLESLKSFSVGLDPESAGMCLGEMEELRVAHNSFARPEPFVMEERQPRKGEEEDVFHFIAYVPFNGAIYELDGLKRGPIKLATLSQGENWFDHAIPHIQERIMSYAANEIKFNLLAVVHDRQLVFRERISELENALAQLQQMGGDDAQILEREYESEVKGLRREIEEEKQKRRRWEMENVRRRHNYVPFLVNLLKILASKGELEPMVEQAKQRFRATQVAESKAKDANK